MEWVEKAAKSVDEAKEQALAALGVTEQDAEVVVVAEPRAGLFGRVRGEARVRARVRPAPPPPKRPRRQRERRRSNGSKNGGSGGGRSTGAKSEQSSSRATAGAGAGGSSGAETTDRQGGAGGSGGSGGSGGQGAGSASGAGGTSSSARRRRRRGGSGRGGRGGQGASSARSDGKEPDGRPDGNGRGETPRGVRREESTEQEGTVAEGVTLAEQGEVARAFLEGLLDRYGLEAEIEVRELDEETVEIAADGEGLGVLVGPKGATLASIQDVTRTVVQRRFPHRTDRILVDVARYRERRAAALRRFAEQVADEVRGSGEERALEPMSPADRKVVHDTVVGIEGVTSSSNGEEPNRFVVISPEHAELS